MNDTYGYLCNFKSCYAINIFKGSKKYKCTIFRAQTKYCFKVVNKVGFFVEYLQVTQNFCKLKYDKENDFLNSMGNI